MYHHDLQPTKQNLNYLCTPTTFTPDYVICTHQCITIRNSFWLVQCQWTTELQGSTNHTNSSALLSQDLLWSSYQFSITFFQLAELTALPIKHWLIIEVVRAMSQTEIHHTMTSSVGEISGKFGYPHQISPMISLVKFSRYQILWYSRWYPYPWISKLWDSII
jgi:hypothetical protein